MGEKATIANVGVTPDQALSVAHADAGVAYRDLSPFRIEITMDEDGWHIDYVLRNPNLSGGGPHYIVDASTGEIRSKRYEQ